MGKTQAAAAYARNRAAAGWPLVAWVTAETQDQLLAGLGRVAVIAGVADDDGDSAVSARNVRRYLETFPGPALVVFDNATDVDGLSAFVPAVGAVQTVITSRDRAFTRLGATVDIGLFTSAQSVAYLTDRTGLDDRDGAAAVAADLGYLPLALAQAATVISDHGWDYATFRQRMRAAPAAQYLTRHAGDPYPQGAVEAIALAIASAGDQDESGLTRVIIALLAVLSAEGVSRAVLAAWLMCRRLRRCRPPWRGMKPWTASWDGWWAGRSCPAPEPGRRSACTAWSAVSCGTGKRRTGDCCRSLVSLPTCCKRFRFPRRKGGCAAKPEAS